MRKPPEKPTSLRPQGITITLPKPTLIIDSMEQRPYSFIRFHKWFAASPLLYKISDGNFGFG
jgi:hypothetical protein